MFVGCVPNACRFELETASRMVIVAVIVRFLFVVFLVFTDYKCYIVVWYNKHIIYYCRFLNKRMVGLAYFCIGIFGKMSVLPWCLHYFWQVCIVLLFLLGVSRYCTLFVVQNVPIFCLHKAQQGALTEFCKQLAPISQRFSNLPINVRFPMYLATRCFECRFFWMIWFFLHHYISFSRLQSPPCIYLPIDGTNTVFDCTLVCYPLTFLFCFSTAWRFSRCCIIDVRAFSRKLFGLNQICWFDTLQPNILFNPEFCLVFNAPFSKLVETAFQREFSSRFLFFCIWF